MPRATHYGFTFVLRTVTCVACSLLALAPDSARTQTPAAATLPVYRTRILGVFDSQSGEAIAGAEVIDVFQRLTATTTRTGTVSLAFLPEGGSMLRIQKIGFQPVTQFVVIAPSDTVAITVLMQTIAQALPAVVTKDAAPRYIAPGLQQFEERRKLGFGRFITDSTLRKSDSRPLANVIRETGTTVNCKTYPRVCVAVSHRNPHGACPMEVYRDGALMPAENWDLEKIQVAELGAVEIYEGISTIPPQYNRSGNGCGIILLWSRER